MTENKHSLIDIHLLPEETVNALLKPAATSLGNAVGDILNSVFNLTLHPLRKYNIVKTSDLEQFAKEINESTSEIPVENRDSSKMGLVLKTIEDSKFQLNDDTMRKLFAQLIANLVDDRRNNQITPRYSEILSNMTPREAYLINYIFNNDTVIPVGKINRRAGEFHQYNSGKQDFLIFDGTKIEGDPDDWDTVDHSYTLDLSLLKGANLIELKETALSDSDNQRLYIHFDKYVETEFTNKSTGYQHIPLHYFYKLTSLGESFCSFVIG
ncbi:Abi-alpha family protein [Marinilactibacillus sp. GCM10026970]|uniref:Abi-alpha family protein n=1 Tax=Marinilactibacillus sp. GCM10026970 TaxID=3252642 RepID=UPI00361B65EF